MDRQERQKQLETLIRQHPDWGYSKLNKNLKEITGQGYRKQTLLDVKRKVLLRSAPSPTAHERTKKIVLITQLYPKHIVRQMRAYGFKDFEIAALLAKTRILPDGTRIKTTPPPVDGETLEAMIAARLELIKKIGKGDIDAGISGDYEKHGWLKDDDTLDFWKMFRDFYRDVGGSPLIEKGKQTTIVFSKGNVAEQKRRYRERQRMMRESPKPTTKGIPVYNQRGEVVYYQHPIQRRVN